MMTIYVELYSGSVGTYKQACSKCLLGYGSTICMK